MRIATWNVNSVRQRTEHLSAWLKEREPDVVCLQELKCMDDAFPREAIESLGYNIETHGQKTFNGVALLSKFPLTDVRRGLPGDEQDQQARYIEGLAQGPDGVVRVASIYLPNGNPVGSEKFPYKLAWMERLIAHARNLLEAEEQVVLAGDYNVIPQPIDAKNPSLWTGDALFQPESRGALRRLCALGYTEAVRAATDDADIYSFWDYQAGAWQKNNGIRIDHLLLSPLAADRFRHARIDKHVRAWDRPSDHAPVVIDLAA